MKKRAPDPLTVALVWLGLIIGSLVIWAACGAGVFGMFHVTR